MTTRIQWFKRVLFATLMSLTSIMATAQTATPQPEADRVILVISAQDGDPKLYTIDPETRDRELFLDLTAFGRLDFAPLSPDGTKLAFVAFEEAEWLNTLYILDRQTSKATQVRIDGGDIGELNWSADSTQLTYLANGINGDFVHIYRYDIKTQTEQELFWSFGGVRDSIIRSMEQSPDSQKIMFSLISFPPDTVVSFVVVKLDGSPSQVLPLVRGSYSPFGWNPLSDTIYFVCDPINDPEAIEVCSMDLATKQLQTAFSQQQLEEFQSGLSERGIYKIEMDGDKLLVQFIPRIVIYDMKTGKITGLPGDVENTQVIGWIDRPTKAPSTVDN